MSYWNHRIRQYSPAQTSAEAAADLNAKTIRHLRAKVSEAEADAVRAGQRERGAWEAERQANIERNRALGETYACRMRIKELERQVSLLEAAFNGSGSPWTLKVSS